MLFMETAIVAFEPEHGTSKKPGGHLDNDNRPPWRMAVGLRTNPRQLGEILRFISSTRKTSSSLCMVK
jgi:hypothetical protein